MLLILKLTKLLKKNKTIKTNPAIALLGTQSLCKNDCYCPIKQI